MHAPAGRDVGHFDPPRKDVHAGLAGGHAIHYDSTTTILLGR